MAEPRKKPSRPDGEYHHFSDITPEAERKIERLLDHLDKENLFFYDMEEEQSWARPKIGEVSQGNQRYVHITISIKLS